MILAVDTTTNVLSVAVTEGRRVLSEYSKIGNYLKANGFAGQ